MLVIGLLVWGYTISPALVLCLRMVASGVNFVIIQHNALDVAYVKVDRYGTIGVVRLHNGTTVEVI